MTALKELLEGAADRARVYDVTERALAGGRKRRRFRLAAGSSAFAILAGALAVVLSLNAPAAAPLTQASESAAPSPSAIGTPAPSACTVSRLPLPSGYPQKSALTAGDPTGRFLGGRAYPYDNRDRLLLWDKGQLILLPTMGEDAEIDAINSKGDAIITAFLGEKIQSWVYHGGTMTRLKGTNVSAQAINDNGVIVGSQNLNDVQSVPIIWPTYTSEPQRLPIPNPAWEWNATASRIDNLGYVIGQGISWKPRTEGELFLWSPEGKLVALPENLVPPGKQALINSLADGQLILGLTTETRSETSYWRVDLQAGLSTKLPLTDRSVKMIAANGWAVIETRTQPALLVGQTSVPMPNIAGHTRVERQLSVSDIRSMSNDGRVIGGYQSVPADNSQSNMEDIVAVVWRCQ